MAKRRRTREEASKPQIDRGTPETRAKLRPDPLLVMLKRRDDFWPEHLQAGQEILDIYMAVGKPLGVRQMAVEPTVDGSKRKEPLWLPHKLDTAYRTVYRPWTFRLHERNMGGLVMAGVIERETMRELDRRFKVRKGTAADTITMALRWYAEMAGWLRQRAA